MQKSIKDLTLARLKKTSFPEVYKDFISSSDNVSLKNSLLLSLAVVFINSSNTYIRKLGYRVIVLYSNKSRNYEPLYEISINMGFFPVAKFITKLYQNSERNRESLFFELNESFLQNFAVGSNYYSFVQKELADSFKKNIDFTMVVVAPTSYGKTDLILSMLKGCQNKNICILTPTKSLLAQTKQRISREKIDWVQKIIIHPEMYIGNEQNILAVLTQERLLRLLKKNQELSFDYIVIDEAHNLLDEGLRATLLASVIILLQKRNHRARFKFLTPFLNDIDNIKISYAKTIHDETVRFKADEYIKTERFYLYDISSNNGILELYDQFMNDFYQIKTGLTDNEFSFVKKYSSAKNIVYINKPRDIERFSINFATHLSEDESPVIEQACKALAEFIHPQYNMINCLKKGVVYHHGSVPDVVRIYIEQLYSNAPSIKYVITSSTLLEGVNLPAERMFILNQKKGAKNLSPSLFKNLIGRVCRFNEIFDGRNKDLSKLESHIYVLKGDYAAKDVNLHAFLGSVAKIDREINDTAKNVLLEATVLTDENIKERDSALEFIENYETGTLEKYSLRSVKTEVGRTCFLNNIKEFDIFEVEDEIQLQVNIMLNSNVIINTPSMLLEKISDLFVCKIDKNDKELKNLLRLKYESTRKFYSMFLSWRINSASFSEMIASFLRYWQKIINEEQDTLVFVGRWGDTTREGYMEWWTDIKGKSNLEKINLAIVRIKEEQDFIDNEIIKFIEVINDLKLIEESFYHKIKYGTDDKREIVLIKNGISLSLSKRLTKYYTQFVVIDVLNSTVEFLEQLVAAMKKNGENQIFTNEVLHYMS